MTAIKLSESVVNFKILTFLKREISMFGISPKCKAHDIILEQAYGAHDCLSKSELRKYIRDYADSLPNELFYE
jgi:hypothetical protein